MSNRYVEVIMNRGSANFLDDIIKNVSGGQFSSGKDLATKFQKTSEVQTKRIDNITALSETNMKILEEDLILLDKVLKTYNTVGYIAGTTAALGTILLALKLKSKYDGNRSI